MRKSTRVIGFEIQRENSKELSNPVESPNDTREQNSSPNEPNKSCISKKCIIIISAISLVVIIGIIIVVVLVTKDGSSDNKTNQISSDTKQPENPQESPESPGNEDDPESPKNPDIPTKKEEEKAKMIETEFEFNTKVGDLYRLNVKQKYTEDVTSFGYNSYQFVGRNTNYDIYFISETNSTEENKYYYNSTYLAAILISSQCIDTKNDNCEPEPYIGLTEIKRRNLRLLPSY